MVSLVLDFIWKSVLLKPFWNNVHEPPFLLTSEYKLTSHNIYFHSFIHSFNKHGQVQASVTILNGNVININLIITFLKDSVFIFYIYVFLHIAGNQKKYSFILLICFPVTCGKYLICY